ncbi:MAG: hypothetical protein M3Y53_05295 [Thermoproteota archaeon]|nr:hypothetical protein [Thermoproteota archaeon]
MNQVSIAFPYSNWWNAFAFPTFNLTFQCYCHMKVINDDLFFNQIMICGHEVNMEQRQQLSSR